MGILRIIWFYVVFIFPFCVCIVLGMAVSYAVKLHFYDMEKYKQLTELKWVNFYETAIKNKIKKRIKGFVITIMACAALLIAYYNFVAKPDLVTCIFLAIALIAGYAKPNEDRSMKNFLKEYDVPVQYEEIEKQGTNYSFDKFFGKH